MDLWLLALAGGALVAGAIASVTGFGVGSIATPLFAARMELPVAIVAVSIPHLIATAQRYWILREHVDRRLLLSFGATSAIGGLAGALLLRQFSSVALEKVFGSVVLLGGIAELSGWMRRVRWSRAAAWIAGAVSGVLGGLVGNQGSVRTAALLGFDIRRESFVATATAIALVVDGARVPIYLASEWSSVTALRWPIAIASIAAVLGTLTGTRVLRRLPEAQFRRIVAVMLIAIGLYFLFR
jgi:uncharacterized membrane protein YfcA